MTPLHLRRTATVQTNPPSSGASIHTTSGGIAHLTVRRGTLTIRNDTDMMPAVGRRWFGQGRSGTRRPPTNSEITALVEDVTGLVFPRLEDHTSITLARAQVLTLLRMAEERGSAVLMLEGLQAAFRPADDLPERRVV